MNTIPTVSRPHPGSVILGLAVTVALIAFAVHSVNVVADCMAAEGTVVRGLLSLQCIKP